MNFALFAQTVGEGAVTGSTNVLLQYGIAGVFIIALVIALVILYRNSREKDVTIEKLQQARVDDAKEITTKLKEPLAQQAELSQRIYDILLTNGERRR